MFEPNKDEATSRITQFVCAASVISVIKSRMIG